MEERDEKEITDRKSSSQPSTSRALPPVVEENELQAQQQIDGEQAENELDDLADGEIEMRGAMAVLKYVKRHIHQEPSNVLFRLSNLYMSACAIGREGTFLKNSKINTKT